MIDCVIKANDFLVTNVNDTQMISIPSKFTSIEAQDFRNLLQKKCNSLNKLTLNNSCSQYKKIIVDFGETTFIDNEGLSILYQVICFAREKNINLTFISFYPQIKKILSLGSLEQLFSIINNNDFSIIS